MGRLGRFSVGRGCCGCKTPVDSCIFVSDNFNRPNNTDVSILSPCGWTETAGNWIIENNAVQVGTQFARLTCNTANPESAYTSVEADIEFGTSTGTARIYIGNHYGEFRAGPSGSINLSESGNLLNVALPRSFRARVCVADGVLRAEVVSEAAAVSDTIATPTLRTFGLGTASLFATAAIRFTSVIARTVKEHCDECMLIPTCVACTDGGPVYWGADMTGISLTDSPTDLNCPFCDDTANYYICSFNSAAPGLCNWGYSEVPNCFGRCRPPDTPPLQQATFGIGVNLELSGGLWRMRATFSIQAGISDGICTIDSVVASWQNNFGDVTADCSGPYTLTGTGSTIDTRLCDGTFPTTITVDRL